ncbi:MAG: hypothetical protein Q4B43_02040 [Bacteroidota bacterium]|nr:hypothetical protein [Bacteroidota bacterium]
MSRDILLKNRWDALVKFLSEKFTDNYEPIDIDGILYLIGIQELGKPHSQFKKDDKLNLMHIGICTVLEPFGYYEFDYYDNDGWPHYIIKEHLPQLRAGEQSLLIKEAIVNYFLNKKII